MTAGTDLERVGLTEPLMRLGSLEPATSDCRTTSQRHPFISGSGQGEPDPSDGN